MFTPIHLLPLYDIKELNASRRRWDTSEGNAVARKIREMIEQGAGEDFLQGEFEQGNLGPLRDQWDLRGLWLGPMDVSFPRDDNFEALDFGFATLNKCRFKDATFFQARFRFATLKECKFERCTFALTQFYGSSLKDVEFTECEFVDDSAFLNCDFVSGKVTRAFIAGPIFIECRFDSLTEVGNLVADPYWGRIATIRSQELATYFRSVKEAYSAGSAFARARLYFYREMSAATRHNTHSRRAKAAGYLLEALAGYGVRPGRVLTAMGGLFILSWLFFSLSMPLRDAFILASGAMFTFGAGAEALRMLPWPFLLGYLITALCGVSLVALLITVWANTWLRER